MAVIVPNPGPFIPCGLAGSAGPGQSREGDKLATFVYFFILDTRGPQVTDRMFAAGAQRLADYVTKEEIDSGMLYPKLSDLRDISLKVHFLAGR